MQLLEKVNGSQPALRILNTPLQLISAYFISSFLVFILLLLVNIKYSPFHHTLVIPGKMNAFCAFCIKGRPSTITVVEPSESFQSRQLSEEASSSTAVPQLKACYFRLHQLYAQMYVILQRELRNQINLKLTSRFAFFAMREDGFVYCRSYLQ